MNAMCIVSWKLDETLARHSVKRTVARYRGFWTRISHFISTMIWLSFRTVPILITLMQIAITYSIADEGTARKIFTEGDGTFQPKSFKLSRWTWEKPDSWNELLGDQRPSKEVQGCRAATSCTQNPEQSISAFCSLWIWSHCLPWEVSAKEHKITQPVVPPPSADRSWKTNAASIREARGYAYVFSKRGCATMPRGDSLLVAEGVSCASLRPHLAAGARGLSASGMASPFAAPSSTMAPNSIAAQAAPERHLPSRAHGNAHRFSLVVCAGGRAGRGGSGGDLGLGVPRAGGRCVRRQRVAQ